MGRGQQVTREPTAFTEARVLANRQFEVCRRQDYPVGTSVPIDLDGSSIGTLAVGEVIA